MPALYIGVSIATFIAILVVLVLRRRRIYRISALTMLGMTTAVLGGFFYGDSRWIGGSLIVVGVLATVVDSRYVKSREQS